MTKTTGLLIAALVLGLTACQRVRINEGTHPPVYVPGPDTSVRHNNVSILTGTLRDRIAIQATNWQRTATGTTQVWVQLRNRTDYRIQVECRTQFFAKDSTPIGKPSAWQRLVLSPNEITTYRENSTQTELGSYYVEIREGQ